ncbi:DUF5076 domain-containing protein [Altererythrobacter sp. Root672]|uniref:DUF5076 domain-containing protein n=1 Tax=Altererythrobacter sp. Root672 TaxID=1736584 RepID=UPI000702122F|nr:hypothetical protein ASD76_09480 [Altererythrobacter sp. Root672]
MVASAHKHAISIDTARPKDSSVEVARLWIEDRGTATCLIEPGRLAEPEMFGTLMVDAIREAARAFSCHDGIPEEEAWNRIWTGVEVERRRSVSPTRVVLVFEEAH